MAEQTQKFDRFVIQSLLGVGGSGRVYRAFDPQNNRVVALKVFMSSDSDEESMSRLRFRREFRAASRLTHPHLVQVYETGINKDSEYYTMEYVEGHDFDEHLLVYSQTLADPTDINDPHRIEHILDLFIQMADALLYLHSSKFVHRDLKPGNVLVSLEGMLKLADFGLMRELGTSQMTRTGSILGTVEYMSPEQTVTARVDSRSDIYSAGVMMYKAFTGDLPFTGGLMKQLIARTKEEAPDPRSINPKLEKRIALIISKTLKRHPEERYQSSQMLLEDLVTVRDQIFTGSMEQTTTTLSVDMPASLILKPALIGRESEIKLLRRCIEQIKGKQSGSLFFIRGETGVGKTRLCDEVQTLASFHGIPFYRASCSETQSTDFQPWTDLLKICFEEMKLQRLPIPQGMERIRDTLIRLIDAIQNPLRSEPAQSTSKEALRYQFFDAACRFFIFLSDKIPMILNLSNFQMAESASIELLQFIARRSIIPVENWSASDVRGHLMILVSCREDEMQASHPLEKLERLLNRSDFVHVIKLKRLDLPQVEEMIKSILGGDHASPNFAERVYRETNGNPLFIESSIRTLVEEGLLKKRGGIWVGASGQSETFSTSETLSLMLPASIKESARRRLVNLPDSELKLLQIASVIGDSFRFEYLLSVSDMDEDEVLDALDLLLRSEIIEEKSQDEEIYGFISNHIRDVAYESLDASEKQKIHSRLADLIAKERPDTLKGLNQLATHLSEAGDQFKAFPVCEQVADSYFQSGNSERALLYIDRALSFIPPDQKNSFFKLKLNRSQCLMNLGKIPEAQAMYRDLIRTTSRLSRSRAVSDDNIRLLMRTQIKALLGLVDIELLEGQLAKAQRINQWLVNHRDSIPGIEDRIQTMSNEGTILMHHGHFDSAREIFIQALEAAENNHLMKPAASCHHNIGNIHFYRMEYDAARQAYEKSYSIRISIGDEKGAASVSNNIGNIYKLHENYQKALDIYREAARTAESVGDMNGWALYIHNMASILLRLGQFDESMVNFRKALAIFEELGNTNQVAMCMNNLALALWEGNRISDARKIMQHAYEMYAEMGYELPMNTCLLNLGSLYLELQDTEQASRCLDTARKGFSRIGPSPGMIECDIQSIRVLIRRAELEEAYRLAHQITLSDSTHKSVRALYHLMMAELKQAGYKKGFTDEDPVHEYTEGIRLFKECRSYAYARTITESYARFLIDSGIDRDRGEALLDEIEPGRTGS